MTTASELFEGAMEWLREHYSEYRFFTERDIEWTLQIQIDQEINRKKLPYRIFNNHTLSAKPRRSADLVVLDPDGSVAVAAELKYELSHVRKVSLGGDIMDGKFPVVFWNDPSGSVGKDVTRVREFVDLGLARVAKSVFIDEGSHFRSREPFDGSEWIDWDDGVSVLWATYLG